MGMNFLLGFQMLEGLQTGQNITWRLLLQKKITQFLDVNFNYQGRKSDQAKPFIPEIYN
jgi:hypothetical protein